MALVALAGCLQVETGTGSPSGNGTTTPSDGGTATGMDGGPESGTGGTACGSDPQTGVTLCLQTDACPNLTVDTSAFPECGFRPGGPSAFDLECLCDGTQLCPIGAPTSCADAQALLAQLQSALRVCEAVSTGGCLPAAGDAGSAGSGAGGSTSGSSACTTCVAQCGGTPACHQACGC